MYIHQSVIFGTGMYSYDEAARDTALRKQELHMYVRTQFAVNSIDEDFNIKREVISNT